MFKPPTDGSAWIKLIAGEYVVFDGSTQPFWEYIEHYNSTLKRSTICSKKWVEDKKTGEREGSGKCIGCYLRDGGAKNVNHHHLHAFQIIWLDDFYLTPATDRQTGEVRRYSQTNKWHNAGDIIYERTLAEAVLDELGVAGIKRAGYEKVFGRCCSWSLGRNHMDILTAKAEDIQTYCKCGGRIYTAVWECPVCLEEAIDMTGEMHYSKKAIDRMTSILYQCKKCGQEVQLKPQKDCDKCHEPKPLDIFMVELEVCRTGSGAQSTLVVNDWRYNSLSKEQQVAVKDLTPDKPSLHRKYGPDTIEYQCKKFKVTNPWQEEEARRHIEQWEPGETPQDGDVSF